MTRAIILVALGGGFGSVLRYLTTLFISRYFQAAYPLGTFAVNITGCLIVGMSLGLFERQQLASPDLKLLFITGFCGGYTTFSAFSAENIGLFQSGRSLAAFLYIVSSITIGMLAVWLGIIITKK
jgi:CrcB protein